MLNTCHMIKRLSNHRKNAEKYFAELKAGNEQGLNYFYNAYYRYYAYRAFRFVKDDLVADAIAQEAFLRLWIMRTVIRDVAQLHEFLGNQLREAGKAYFGKTINRFYRSMLRLDGIENVDDFMLGYEWEEGDTEDTVHLEQLEEEKRRHLEKLNDLLPNLDDRQQLSIRLCLKFDFNYERIEIGRAHV